MKEKLNARQQQALHTKQKITEISLQLFEKYGFEDVSIEKIAFECNVAVGTIYYYFKNKDEIAAQTVINLDAQYLEFFNLLFEDETLKHLPAEKKLEKYFIHVQKTASTSNTLLHAYIYDFKNSKHSKLRVDTNRGMYKHLTDLILNCKAENVISQLHSTDTLIEIITQLSRGILTDWIIRDKDFDIEIQAFIMFELFSHRYITK